MSILVIAYIIAGYWATGQTIYANRIIITTMKDMFFSRLAFGMLFGFILIPWALVKCFLCR